MTVAAELLKTAQRLEVVVAIEGVGWPSVESDLSQGFDGDVWTTADLDGDLAARLGCTVHQGLTLSGSVGDKLDSRKAEFSVGGIGFTIVDHDSWWQNNFTPHATPTVATLGAALSYGSTSIDIDGGAVFAEGDVVYIGGREAVKLGTEGAPAGSRVVFSSSTRGYLGTLRGSPISYATAIGSVSWKTGTGVYDVHRFWSDRRVNVFLHVPGEAVSNCVRIWSGRLRSVKSDVVGSRLDFQCAGDPVPMVRKRYVAPQLRIRRERYRATTYYPADDVVNNGAPGSYFATRVDRAFEFEPFSEAHRADENRYALATLYDYRTVPGGTVGMKTTWDADNTDVQSETVTTPWGTTANRVNRYIEIDGTPVYLRFSDVADPNGAATARREVIYCGAGNEAEEDLWVTAEMLDGWGQFDGELLARAIIDPGRMKTNGRVLRHPIEVALAFLTTRDDEYFIGDALGTSTTTVVDFTVGTVGEANAFTGAWLFCVEGVNKGEARKIASNTADDITVEVAFTNTPGAGDEYQVRNSEYDVLPLGQGLNVPWQRIDVDSFETIRDKYLHDAKLSYQYFIGIGGEAELYNIVENNVLRPYGVYLYTDRASGKLTAGYLTNAYGSGVDSTYTGINESDFITIGDIDRRLGGSIGRVEISVQGPLKFKVGDDTLKITAISGEIEGAFGDSDLDTIKLDAFLTNSTGASDVIARAQRILLAHAVPPPVVNCTVDIRHALTLQAGDMCSLSFTGPDGAAPISPFSTARGWSTIAARCIGTSVSIAGTPGLQCTFELLREHTGGRIAPACEVRDAGGSTFRGSDGTSHWINVEAAKYVIDSDTDKDMYHFAVGDLIEVRDSNGVLSEGPLTIRSFGANDSADPNDADTNIIRVDESLSGTYSETHYVTLTAWSASNTARMEQYSAYADAAATLDTDTARRYG